LIVIQPGTQEGAVALEHPESTRTMTPLAAMAAIFRTRTRHPPDTAESLGCPPTLVELDYEFHLEMWPDNNGVWIRCVDDGETPRATWPAIDGEDAQEDEARRLAVNFAKLPDCAKEKGHRGSTSRWPSRFDEMQAAFGLFERSKRVKAHCRVPDINLDQWDRHLDQSKNGPNTEGHWGLVVR
jgi:hypothetical protein